MFLYLNRRIWNSNPEYCVNVGVEGDTNLKIAGIMTITWQTAGGRTAGVPPRAQKFVSEYSSDGLCNKIYPNPSKLSILNVCFDMPSTAKVENITRKRARPSDI